MNLYERVERPTIQRTGVVAKMWLDIPESTPGFFHAVCNEIWPLAGQLHAAFTSKIACLGRVDTEALMLPKDTALLAESRINVGSERLLISKRARVSLPVDSVSQAIREPNNGTTEFPYQGSTDILREDQNDVEQWLKKNR